MLYEDLRAQINKGVLIKIAAGDANVDYAKKIMGTYRKMMAENRLLTGEELEGYYRAFQDRFNPQKLRSLEGEALLETLFGTGNKDSLIYWLEFKNDDEFPTLAFGGIGGGSAHKFGIFKRKEDGRWITGSSKREKELTVEEAIQKAAERRELILRGAEIIDSMPDNYDDETYIK